MSWYAKGSDAVKNAVQKREEQRANMPPRRVWIEQNSSIYLVYLDDVGFTFQEHAVEVPGRKFPDHVTCLRPTGKRCPLCDAGKKPYYITLYSVVDLSVWKDKNGVEHKNEKRVHALKAEPALALANKAQRWGGLIGKCVIVSRKGQKDYSAGSDFEMAMKDGRPIVYKIDTSKPEHAPFDYEKYYAPKTEQEILEIMRQCGIGSSAGAAVAFEAPNANPWGNSNSSKSSPQFGDFGGELMPTDAPAATVSDDGDVPF